MLIFEQIQKLIIIIIQNLSKIFPDNFWQLITDFGDYKIILIIFIGITVSLGQSRLAINLLIMFSFAIITLTIKNLLNWQRPIEYFDNDQLNIIGDELHNYSFPSGHATSIALLYLLVLINFKNRNKLLDFFLLSFAIMVSISRIIIGAHWPQDILAAWILVFIFTPILNRFFSKYMKRFIYTGVTLKYLQHTLIFILILLFISFFSISKQTIYISGLISLSGWVICFIYYNKKKNSLNKAP